MSDATSDATTESMTEAVDRAVAPRPPLAPPDNGGRIRFALVYLTSGDLHRLKSDIWEVYPLPFSEIIIAGTRKDLPWNDILRAIKELPRGDDSPTVTMAQTLEDLTELRAVDCGVGFVKRSTFYVVAEAGEPMAALLEAVAAIGVGVAGRRLQLIGVKPLEQGYLHGLVFHTLSHRRPILGGNEPMVVENADGTVEHYALITDKLERFQRDWYADREDPPRLLYTHAELREGLRQERQESLVP